MPTHKGVRMEVIGLSKFPGPLGVAFISVQVIAAEAQ